MTDIALRMTLEEFSQRKSHVFKKLLETKVKKMAVQYLLYKIKSKGKEISYDNILKCQGYLMPNSILTLQEKKLYFLFYHKWMI